MKRITRLLWVVACCLASTLVAASGPAGPGDALFLRPSDVTWEQPSAGGRTQTHLIWTDPKTGAWGGYRKRPGNDKIGLHAHSQDGRVLMFTGTIVITMDGEKAQELGPGSYFLVPAGAKHTSDSKSGSDCFYYEEQPGPADITFVER